MTVVDLHLHTTASDGRLSPTELVRFLARRGIRAAAITDHDSTEGLDEAFKAAEETPNLTLIPGIELSADVPGSEVHILGYFMRWEDREFQETLEEFRRGRVRRAKGIVEKLAQMGLEMEWERVLELAGSGAVGRPHVALAMVEKGFVKDTREAFTRYIGRNGPAYVERMKLTPKDAIALIRKVGGAAVLAHPSWVDNLEESLKQLKEADLAGMEVYYGSYSPEMVRHFARLAEQLDLIPCGGSDYHAMGTEDESLPGDQGPPEKVVEELCARAMRVPEQKAAPPVVP